MIELAESPEKHCTPPQTTTQLSDPVVPTPGHPIKRDYHTPLWGGGSIDTRVNELRLVSGPRIPQSVGEFYPQFTESDRYITTSAGRSTSEDETDGGYWDISGDATSEMSRPQFRWEQTDETREEYFSRIRREEEAKRKKREAKKTDPDHEDQTTLGNFENAAQEEVNPDAVDHDERLDGLPVFLPDEEVPKVHINDPNRSGPEYCTQCGGREPWEKPLERGVNAIRGGDARDGNPNYDHCNPNVTNVRSCDCCGCPRCAAKSIRYRKTKEPSWACGNPNCGIEFNHPIERPNDTDKRECLYWTCRYCGEPTQAPFPGIPEGLL